MQSFLAYLPDSNASELTALEEFSESSSVNTKNGVRFVRRFRSGSSNPFSYYPSNEAEESACVVALVSFVVKGVHDPFSCFFHSHSSSSARE